VRTAKPPGLWFDRTQEYAARRRREDFDPLKYAEGFRCNRFFLIIPQADLVPIREVEGHGEPTRLGMGIDLFALRTDLA